MECKHLTRFWTHIFSFWESLNNIYELSGHAHGYSYKYENLYSSKDILIHFDIMILYIILIVILVLQSYTSLNKMDLQKNDILL